MFTTINPLQAETLSDAISRVQPGGYVVLHKGARRAWWPHREGIVILNRSGQFLLNGCRPLSTDEWDSYYSDPEGVAIRYRGRYFINGAPPGFTEEEYLNRNPSRLTIHEGKFFHAGDFICGGEWIAYGEHPDGVVIARGTQLLLNGYIILYQGPWHSWRVHPSGIAIEWHDEVRLYPTIKQPE